MDKKEYKPIKKKKPQRPKKRKATPHEAQLIYELEAVLRELRERVYIDHEPKIETSKYAGYIPSPKTG